MMPDAAEPSPSTFFPNGEMRRQRPGCTQSTSKHIVASVVHASRDMVTPSTAIVDAMIARQEKGTLP